MQIQRYDVGPRMTQCVVHNNTVYLCGQTAENKADSAAGQTKHILARIDELLAQVGSSKSKLLQVQIWLADIRYYDEMNAVWDAWVDPANTPGRATCEARMAYPNVLVEIIATAAL
jgi:enamine deaminase RidA (YjgF/YER057c/UK114 family)